MRVRRPRLRSLRFLFIIFIITTAAACREDGTITVRRLSFVGVTAVDETRLRTALATRQSSRLPWGRQQQFDNARFDEDLKRISAYYADRGYPDARVTAFDVKLNDEQDAVDVTLTIEEGAPVLVGSVDFVGFGVLPPDRLADLRERAPLTVGTPRDRQQVVSTLELAVAELREHGYPYATVATSETDGASGREAAVVFTADPGTLARFGAVEIVGHQSVGEEVIRRKLGYRVGDQYRRSLVQDSQRTLYGLELFQFVNIEALDPEKQEPEVRTRVTVVEGRHQRVNFGVGYGTEDKGRVHGDYRHVNFFGGARTAGVQARWSSLDRGVRASFNQPYVFAPHFSAGLDGQEWRTVTPAYESLVSGGRATLTHRSNPRAAWAVSFGSEYNSSTISDEALNDPTLVDDLIALGLDPTTGRQDGTLTSIAFDFNHSTTNNLLDARRGYQLGLHGEGAGSLLPGTFNFTALTFDARHFLPLGERLVVANRLQVGNINPKADDPGNVPFSKKFLLGGSTSIRGWGRYEVSPLGGEGTPIGGNSMLSFTSELRAILLGSLGGVVFLDGGNVWEDDWSVAVDDLRYAVGAGLRYVTPVGPVRVDWGYQLNPIDGLLVEGAPQERRWRLHFSIGQAF